MNQTLLVLCFITFAVSSEDARGFWFIEAARKNAIIVAKSNAWPWDPEIVSINPMYSESTECDGLNSKNDYIKRPFIYEKNNVDDFYVWIIKGVEVSCLRRALTISVSYVASERSEKENITYASTHPPSSDYLEKMGAPNGAVAVELRFPFAINESVNFPWLEKRSRISIVHSNGMVSAIFPGVNAVKMDVSCYDSNGRSLTPLQKEYVVSDGIKFISLKYPDGSVIKVCDFIKTDK